MYLCRAPGLVRRGKGEVGRAYTAIIDSGTNGSRTEFEVIMSLMERMGVEIACKQGRVCDTGGCEASNVTTLPSWLLIPSRRLP